MIDLLDCLLTGVAMPKMIFVKIMDMEEESNDAQETSPATIQKSLSSKKFYDQFDNSPLIPPTISCC